MMKIQELLETKLGKTIKEASNAEVYYALLHVVQNMAKDKEVPVKKKKIYYISAEFLIGKLLSNNMINLGIYDDVKKMLAENGKDICEIEEIEPEPSLGNGGLGRLAACFLDSIATLGLSGDGVGLNYHLGLFKQEFKDELQNAVPNPWIEKESWLTKTEVSYPVTFGNLTVNSRMYDIEVTGYNTQSNKLHLFDLESVDDSIVKEGIDFDKEYHLLELIRAVHEIDGIERIRLGSLEPGIITEEFAEGIAKLPKMCPHFHLSLQSGCDATLKRMNRRYTSSEYAEKCELLRKYFPNPALTTDVIVGFPGETEEEFKESYDFVDSIDFYETHIFKYSRREGTKAAVMPDQVDEQIKAKRSAQLIELGEKKRAAYEQSFQGKEVEVLVEEDLELNGKEVQIGHTKEYMKIALETNENLKNSIVKVQIGKDSQIIH